MSDESNATNEEKSHPLLFAMLAFILKRLEVIIIAGVAYYMAHNGEHRDVQWLGKHIADKQSEIQQLEKSNESRPN
jgi:hypothetical protein